MLFQHAQNIVGERLLYGKGVEMDKVKTFFKKKQIFNSSSPVFPNP